MKIDNFQAIVRAMKNGDMSTLNNAQLRLFDIYNMADNLITQYGPGKESAYMLQTMIEQKYGEKPHLHSCYAYISQGQNVLNSRSGISKPYWKNFMVEKLVRLINHIENEIYFEHPIEDKEGNPTEATRMASPDPKLTKEYREAIKELRELLQLDKEEPVIDPDEDIDTIIISSNPADAGFTEFVEMSEELEQTLIGMGAQKDANGNWK